jgi:hypothetical protein
MTGTQPSKPPAGAAFTSGCIWGFTALSALVVLMTIVMIVASLFR